MSDDAFLLGNSIGSFTAGHAQFQMHMVYIGRKVTRFDVDNVEEANYRLMDTMRSNLANALNEMRINDNPRVS